MTTSGGRPGNNWDGHLPSDKMERAILNASEGIEDEDGKTNGFLKQDDDEMAVFRQQRVNTGPKGVIEDQRRHVAMQKLVAQADSVRQKEQLRRAANPTVRPAGEEEDDDEDEDDEEFRKYKLERLREMQKTAAASVGMPSFGVVETVAALDMPKAIDTVGSRQTYVVVHLQEEYLASCVRLTYKLGELAKTYDQVRFLNVKASEAKPDLDPAELPLLIAYQDGSYLADARKVGRAEGDGLTSEKVAEQLMAMGVRLQAASQMKAGEAAALRKMRELGLGADAAGGSREEEEEDDEEEEEEEEADGILKRKGVRIVGLS